MAPLLAQLAQSFSSVERFGTNIARRRRLAAILCGLLVLLVRAAEIPRLPTAPKSCATSKASPADAGAFYAITAYADPPYPGNPPYVPLQ